MADEPIVLGLNITTEHLEEIHAFQTLIGAQNEATALWQAMHWITEFRAAQDHGAILCLVKEGKIIGIQTLKMVPAPDGAGEETPMTD